MTDVIRCVSGDDRPTVTLTITDETTGDPFDLSDAGTTINIKFRAVGSTTVLDTIPCTKVDGANGIISFDFSGGVLVGLAAGMYEGEIEIDLDGAIHTVYEPLKFRVRAEF